MTHQRILDSINSLANLTQTQRSQIKDVASLAKELRGLSYLDVASWIEANPHKFDVFLSYLLGNPTGELE